MHINAGNTDQTHDFLVKDFSHFVFKLVHDLFDLGMPSMASNEGNFGCRYILSVEYAVGYVVLTEFVECLVDFFEDAVFLTAEVGEVSVEFDLMFACKIHF